MTINEKQIKRILIRLDSVRICEYKEKFISLKRAKSTLKL
jgi:hypothetical protein